jgi:choline dehydrogenase-like flavoprotein
MAAMEDRRLLQAVVRSALAGLAETRRRGSALRRLLETEADPNDIRNAGAGGTCLCYTPLSTAGHSRTGARERLLAVAARYPDRLRIQLHTLASRVILDDANRAVGVEYLQGERLYRADPNAVGIGQAGRIVASREVILAGGAFNSPQLLLLSGIGGPELAEQGIPVRVPLSGVGRNLQDRYEVAVVNKMRRPWGALSGARFEPGDSLFRQWNERRDGMYVSNGAALAMSFPSAAGVDPPDLFCMGLLARFEGYYPGYSGAVAAHHDYLSWTVLKAHTFNRAGRVSLRSADPRDPPEVDFNYFAEGGGEDLRAVVSALRFARGLSAGLGDLVEREEEPGPAIRSDNDLAGFVRDRAWGHHASCSCPIGPRNDGGVLDSAFRVHGVSALRVVDASVFPRIPGFFIAGAIYMAAEKAADAILTDAIT